MDVKINQVILHILDAGASEPVLSDRPMELDADLYEYFSVCIEKAFASDDSKNCRFLPDSPFLQEMRAGWRMTKRCTAWHIGGRKRFIECRVCGKFYYSIRSAAPA